MITVTQIRGGADYLGRHLSMNDYYSEEERVVGHWHGEGAERLGLKGLEVTRDAFEALRSNRHPHDGGKLRPRSAQVAFHDFVISAPKSVSIAAVTGGDERLSAAYEDCALRAFARLEAVAAVRVRGGSFVGTEELTVTGNAVAAVFHHNTSRMLDPQLHSHLVFANLTYDPARGGWFALQPKLMAEASAENIRGLFYRELETACRNLGYRTEWTGESFRLADLEPADERRMSQRAVQREAFEHRYRDLFGEPPDKKRVEQFIKDRKQAAVRRFEQEYKDHFGYPPSAEVVGGFVRDCRSDKMATSSAHEVLELQRQRLGDGGAVRLRQTILSARSRTTLKPTDQTTGPEDETAVSTAPERLESPDLVQPSVAAAKLPDPVKTNATNYELLRRYRRGLAIAAALRGQPAALIRMQFRSQHRRNHGS
jgi:conjugative relaxase-like TrwC/TraI family protein